MFQKTFFLSVLLLVAGFIVANAQPPHLRNRKADTETTTQQAEDIEAADTAGSEVRRRRMPPRPPRPGMPMQFMSWEQQDSVWQARKERIAKEKALVAGYGANFVRVYPLHLMDQASPGLGLEYERLLGKKRIFGVVVPVSYTPGLEGNIYFPFSASQFLLVAPGIKFYPTGQRKVTYACGPSLFFGYGQDIYERFSAQPPRFQGEKVSRYKMGFLINNYLNMQPSKHFSFSMTLGFGYKFFNNSVFSDNTYLKYGELESAHLSVGMGYRF